MSKYVPIQYDYRIDLNYLVQLIKKIGSYHSSLAGTRQSDLKKGVLVIVNTCNGGKFAQNVTKTEVKSIIKQHKKLFNANYKMKVPLSVEYILSAIHQLVDGNDELVEECKKFTSGVCNSNKCFKRLYNNPLSTIDTQLRREIRFVLNDNQYLQFSQSINSVLFSNIVCR